MADLDYMLAKPSARGDGMAVVHCEPCNGTGFLPGDHACLECWSGERQANELHLAYTLIEIALSVPDELDRNVLLMEAQTALQDAQRFVQAGCTLDLEQSAAGRAETVWRLLRAQVDKVRKVAS